MPLSSQSEPADQHMRRSEILNVKEIEALAEYLGFMAQRQIAQSRFDLLS